MEYLPLILLVLIIYYFFRDKGDEKSSRGQSKSTKTGTNVSQRYRNPIPKGYQIYSSGLPVAGISYRKGDAIDFLQGMRHSLEFERDPSNEHDPNAIKIFGISTSGRFHIGFIPADEAEIIVKRGFFDHILPRLNYLYLSDGGYIEIDYDVLIQREQMKVSRALDLEEPVSKDQKDFLRYFEQSIPKGLTVGQADQLIAEFTDRMNVEQPGKIDEYNAYQDILNELDDKDERDMYDLKKPPMAVVEQALKQLQAQGMTYVQIHDDMQTLADEIFKIRPDLEKE
jgi:hypothetical protein